MDTFRKTSPPTRSGLFNPRALIVSSGCALLLLAIAMPWEEATAASPTQASRPKIGLALGGGGARGAAHVGVLKVLEELQIPIDYIAGTSMGAIVGGLYAAGYSPEEIEEIVETIDWDRIVSDRPPREQLTFRRKQEDFNLLVKFEIGFRNGKFRTPEAIIQGALLDGTLRWFALRAHNISDFDGLPIPYRAIAADIDTGEMVVLDRGNLGVAMRASSSIAGVFTPVQVEGRFLVDGGIVRNLPIDVVRGMGADIVIAVDVGSPLRIVSEGLVGVADQVLRMITRRNADEQIKQLRDEDVLIQVALDDIGALQFGRAAEAALIGEVAARRRASALARYRVPEDQYRSFIRRQRVTPWSPPQVDYIRIDNNSPVNPDAIKARMTLKPGDVLDKQSLERDLERIYGMGDFEYVSFLLVEDEDLIGLIVETRGKSWGPNYLRFGFNLEDDFDGNNQFSIIADFTKRPVNRLGAEWKNQLSVGEFRGIRSEFYQPLAASGRWFVAPQLEIVESGDEVGEGETRTRSAIVDLGVNLGKVCCELRVGAVASDVNASGGIGFVQPPTGEGDLGAYRVNFTYDLLDNIAFPRHGSSVGLGGFYARRDVNDSDFEYDRTRLDWATAGSVRRHTFIGFASLGSSGTSTLPPFAEFSLGGFLNLSGLKPNELRGQYFGVLRFIYYFRLKRLGFGHALYVGGSLEAGNVWDDRDHVFDDNIAAGSVFFGADTIVGPLYAAYGSAEDDRNAFYLFLGRVFRLD